MFLNMFFLLNIINSSKINNNFLAETFISVFDQNYTLKKNIKNTR